MVYTWYTYYTILGDMLTNQIAAFLRDGSGTQLHMQAEPKVTCIWPLHFILIPLGKTGAIWSLWTTGTSPLSTYFLVVYWNAIWSLWTTGASPLSTYFLVVYWNANYLWILHSGIVMRSLCMARVFPCNISTFKCNAQQHVQYLDWVFIGQVHSDYSGSKNPVW